jgi:hypothetical protein
VAAKQEAPRPAPPVTQQAQRPTVSAPGVQQPAAPPAAAKQEAPQPAAQPAAAQPAPAGAAQAAVGYITVGTRPVSTIYVNGVAKGSRLVNLEVPAGSVRLRFQVQDSTGMWWAQDREVTVAAGERKVLGYIQLVRP